MKVLSVASEIYPLVKTGGLADVTGALPGAVAPLGVETRTVVPGYPAIMAQVGKGKVLAKLPDVLGHSVKLLGAKVAGLDLIVVQVPGLFEREGGPYAGLDGIDFGDNWKRFAVLSKAAALIATGALKGYRPDVVHVHDWQAAMVPCYLAYGDAPPPPSVITVHNIAFQGQFAAHVFGELDLPATAWADGVEYYGGVGFLKAGLRAAQAITTVSPTYAREIRTGEFGMGLEGLINGRSDVVSGIVNGIDVDVWDPAKDARLVANFSARALKARGGNRKAVLKTFGLAPTKGPVIAIVSRLTWQKGMDLLAEAMDGIVAAGASLAVLGAGDRDLEHAFAEAAARHPGRVAVHIGYDEPLAHLMQGGCDAILIPSRFEPCGLTQLYGLRYGCVPIVARTGGLADTVIDANMAARAAGVGTGFHIGRLTAERIVDAVTLACEVYADTPEWTRMMKNGMATDVSWDASAKGYVALYRRLLEQAA
ncbi:glycogen synthase GlgA [Maritimibacter sp. DP1N21-5]|uniref:glycogen synthase GlgA n=1 Tax=Maritimibacter sp. DP1N21-5 TaxID=2836867 RepID=UPI001C45B7D4|nr:glycogen synthase GlgA [Maritimibacter sp. DP1N21-5]MBV7407704.1 glycogen synthase GlgA [Maritimibacter sp. DP1N21-5]